MMIDIVDKNRSAGIRLCPVMMASKYQPKNSSGLQDE